MRREPIEDQSIKTFLFGERSYLIEFLSTVILGMKFDRFGVLTAVSWKKSNGSKEIPAGELQQVLLSNTIMTCHRELRREAFFLVLIFFFYWRFKMENLY